jgi:branched-chain amino acid aminotransferase
LPQSTIQRYPAMSGDAAPTECALRVLTLEGSRDMIVYLNGSYLDATEARVSLFDAGYLYGDGLFETLRLYAGRPFDLKGHLDRLQRQLELLAFAWRPDYSTVNAVLHELADRNGLADADARVRLTVSRGGLPGRPLLLQDLDTLTPSFSIMLEPLPPEIAVWQEDGIHALVMKATFARGNFPQLKSLNYLSSLLALRFAVQRNCQEAILVDRQGKILEGATSNIFLVSRGTLYTPPTRLGLLAGRTRSLVLEAARALRHACHEEAFERRELLTADEVFLTGSVREVVPVVRIDDAPVGDGRAGPVTRALQTRYRQDVADILAAADSGSERTRS